MNPLIESWSPVDRVLNESLTHFQRQAEVMARAMSWPTKSVMGDVSLMPLHGLGSVVTCVEAWPHIDTPTLGRWFVLWNLFSNGHVLHARDSKVSVGDDPRWRPGHTPMPLPDQSVEMRVGEMVILDAHREHWMDSPSAPYRWKRWYVAPCDDLKTRPTRRKAEATMRERIMSMGGNWKR